MMSDRKFLWLIWFVRIVTLFQTSAGLYAVYLATFVSPDVMDSCGGAVSALAGASIFFSTFPWLRIHVRVNQLKKQLSHSSDFANTLKGGAPTRNDARHKIILIVMLIIAAALIIFNFVFAWIAYRNSRDLELFVHMVVVAATVLGFNSFLLVDLVNENFKKIERLIAQYKRDQASKEESE